MSEERGKISISASNLIMVIVALLGLIVSLISWLVMQVTELHTHIEVVQSQIERHHDVQIQLKNLVLKYHMKEPEE